MKRILTVMVVLGFVVSPLAFASETVYKWTDKSGTVHFSDRPVNGADAEEMKVRSSRPAAGDQSEETEEETASDEGATTKEPSKGDQQADVQEQQKKIREQNCQIARQTLQHNESIGRMYRVGADGERVFLSDEEREIVLKSSREDIVKWCD